MAVIEILSGKVRIGEGKDIPDDCTPVEVPAKVIKTREEGWHLA